MWDSERSGAGGETGADTGAGGAWATVAVPGVVMDWAVLWGERRCPWGRGDDPAAL